MRVFGTVTAIGASAGQYLSLPRAGQARRLGLGLGHTTQLKGVAFCLGYGTSAAEMTAAARMRTVATIPDPNATGASSTGCLPQSISSNCLFNWAERSYPQFFAPAAAVSATCDQY